MCYFYRLVKENICWNSLRTTTITKTIQSTTSELSVVRSLLEGLGPVVQSIGSEVSFLWKITLVSAKHASSNSGLGPFLESPENFSDPKSYS